MSRNLRIVLIHPPHESEARAQALHSGLAEAGYDLVASLPADFHLPEHIARLQPDMIIVDAESDARDVLEHIVIATRDERRPIVMFTEDDQADSMEAAMAAGVSAYVVAGLQPERIKPVLDVALVRFKREQKLLDELAGTRLKLAERKLLDRAKGILMARQGLTEEQAFQKLRGMAMNKNLKLAELAQRILDAEDLLG
ncbi:MULTISPECIES: ANTAR domain-containing response regulator [unclassified Duganella]|uniref:ANTAR domain-containing response regulator n=1 Tax=unclassified Duganella TaxID=2636909 RepID=UPI000700D7E8|nr:MULTISPECIES: ANTAR domain-containing protein [unclassified Duganella]KQV47629.1 response regulator [Duganella sp. Root336D2]KRB82083.1 response regulator [Duganella sp. Root198D2]